MFHSKALSPENHFLSRRSALDAAFLCPAHSVATLYYHVVYAQLNIRIYYNINIYSPIYLFVNPLCCNLFGRKNFTFLLLTTLLGTHLFVETNK